MKHPLLHVVIITFFSAATAAWAAPDPPPEDKEKKLEQAHAAIAAQDWAGAQAILRAALQQDAANAEYHNLYAYSIRKGERPRMDLVFRHYHEALRIRPQHRGAHEYLGEAYLMVGNVAKAREHLAALEQLCAAGCDERGKLAAAIADFGRGLARK